MKVSLIFSLCFLMLSSLTHAQGLVEDVFVTNESLKTEVLNDELKVIVTENQDPTQIVAPMFTPAELRSIDGSLRAKAGKQRKASLQFNEPVTLREVTFGPTYIDGACQVRISINDLLAKKFDEKPVLRFV